MQNTPAKPTIGCIVHIYHNDSTEQDAHSIAFTKHEFCPGIITGVNELGGCYLINAQIFVDAATWRPGFVKDVPYVSDEVHGLPYWDWPTLQK